jgi:CheY-like chemotaxis protein
MRADRIDARSAIATGIARVPSPSRSTSPPETTIDTASADEPLRAKFPATVLIVDDDDAVRVTIGMILQDLGYSVLESATGESALELLRVNPHIALLLTDVVMPGMNGIELARHARAMRATLPIVFISGYADPNSVVGDTAWQPILHKPFRANELAVWLDAALAYARDTRDCEGAPGAR